MGQKVNPISFRVGYIKGWESLWYSKKKSYADKLLEDTRIRRYIKANFKQCAISNIVIERASEKIRVNIHTARPGVIIGRKGADIDRLRDELTRIVTKEIQINIREIKNPAMNAQLVAENVALQLERRIAFRRAMKKSMQQTMDAGAKGIKIRTKGRLGGSEIARMEWYRVGAVPLQTIRADVDYGFTEAMMPYGKIGVKVWIYKGDIIDRPNLFDLYGQTDKEASARPGRGASPKREITRNLSTEPEKGAQNKPVVSSAVAEKVQEQQLKDSEETQAGGQIKKDDSENAAPAKES